MDRPDGAQRAGEATYQKENQPMFRVFMGRSCITARDPLPTLQAAVDHAQRVITASRSCGFTARRTYTIVQGATPVRTITG